MSIIAVGLGGIAVYAFGTATGESAWNNLSVGFMVAGAALGVGGFFGLLFGIPRAMARQPVERVTRGGDDAASETSRRYTEPNTNLEQIADWLTKILLGAGLTQLNKIPARLDALCAYIGKGMGGTASDQALAGAIIISFGLFGFFTAFLWTRLYMPDLLARSELETLWSELKESHRQLESRDQEQQELIVKNQQSLLRVREAVESTAVKSIGDTSVPQQGRGSAQRAPIEIAASLVKGQEAGATSAKEYLILGFHSLQEGKYAEAAANLEKALTAKPSKEELWKIYNFLGLSYHYQQPTNWKAEHNLTWFEKAVQSYRAAIENQNNRLEGLLAQANLSFVYLDVEKYDDAVKLASEVIAAEASGDKDVASVFDLARIAAAAAKYLLGDEPGAAKLLNEIRDINQFQYLFNRNELPEKALQGFSRLSPLRSDTELFLKRATGMGGV